MTVVLSIIDYVSKLSNLVLMVYIAKLIQKQNLIYFDIASSSEYDIIMAMQYRNIPINVYSFCIHFAMYAIGPMSIRLLILLTLF